MPHESQSEKWCPCPMIPMYDPDMTSRVTGKLPTELPPFTGTFDVNVTHCIIETMYMRDANPLTSAIKQVLPQNCQYANIFVEDDTIVVLVDCYEDTIDVTFHFAMDSGLDTWVQNAMDGQSVDAITFQVTIESDEFHCGRWYIYGNASLK